MRGNYLVLTECAILKRTFDILENLVSISLLSNSSLDLYQTHKTQ